MAFFSIVFFPWLFFPWLFSPGFLSDPSFNKILLIVIVSDQKWAADLYHLLHLLFGTLSLGVFVPQIHYRLSKVYSRPFHGKSLFLQISACTMSPRFSTTRMYHHYHAMIPRGPSGEGWQREGVAGGVWGWRGRGVGFHYSRGIDASAPLSQSVTPVWPPPQSVTW